MICYQDFCRDLEKQAASEAGEIRYTKHHRDEASSRGRRRVVDGDGFDGRRHSEDENVLKPEYVEKWYNDATPREQKDFDRVYDSIERFRSSVESDEDGGRPPRLSSTYYPPKPSESVSRLRLSRTSMSSSTSRGIAASSESPRYRSPSPARNSLDRSYGGTLNAPRSPPSKVGSIMWGNETPLSKKGR
jgi:hypothetical protein